MGYVDCRPLYSLTVRYETYASHSLQELLARYNPIHHKTEQERIRLTARRVGLDLPKDYEDGDKK